MIASCKRCEVEPRAWLNAVLRELPLLLAPAEPDKPPDLTDLIPDTWLKAHPEHRWKIDDLQKKNENKADNRKSTSEEIHNPIERFTVRLRCCADRPRGTAN
jgi:hypothetical protein